VGIPRLTSFISPLFASNMRFLCNETFGTPVLWARMPREKDSGKIDLREMFLHIQNEMLTSLSVRKLLEHPTVCGAATEHHWIDLFNRYLPERYRASSAFIVDAGGNGSRQIDIAIYDR
jgi:hypothetical protein